jgi:hypothetical protein
MYKSIYKIEYMSNRRKTLLLNAVNITCWMNPHLDLGSLDLELLSVAHLKIQ